MRSNYSLLEEKHQAMLAVRYPGRMDVIPLFQPSSIREMRDWLITYAPAVEKWERKRVYKLWKEVRGTAPETFLVAVPTPEGHYVDRNIRTVTVRAFHHRHEPTAQNPLNRVAEFLWEFRINEDGSLKLRPFENSFSEKLYWIEIEHVQALQRAFREELGWTGQKRNGRRRKSVAKRHLLPPYLGNLADYPDVTYFKGGTKQVEPKSHHDSEKFPGLKTNNELMAHYVFVLNPATDNPRIAAYDEAYYQPWYHETRTPNIFVFGDYTTPKRIRHLADLGLSLDDLDINFAA
jgi:hypothetical protein